MTQQFHSWALTQQIYELVFPRRHKNVSSSFIQKNPTLQTIQISINSRIKKQSVVHPYNGILHNKEKGQTNNTQCQGWFPQVSVTWKTPDTEEDTQYGSFHMKFKDRQNYSMTAKSDWRILTSKKEHEETFWRGEHVLSWSGWYTGVFRCKNSLSWNLKTVHVILRKLYLIQRKKIRKQKRKCPLELCVTLCCENPDTSLLRGFTTVFQDGQKLENLNSCPRFRREGLGWQCSSPLPLSLGWLEPPASPGPGVWMVQSEGKGMFLRSPSCYPRISFLPKLWAQPTPVPETASESGCYGNSFEAPWNPLLHLTALGAFPP